MKLRLTFALLLAATAAHAWDWDWTWRMPSKVYKALEFSSRAGVDRAAGFYARAEEAERRGTRMPDLVPQYRLSDAEWRKVQIQAEAEGGGDDLIAYCIFMQGMSKMHAKDTNKAIKDFETVLDLYEGPEQTWVTFASQYMLAHIKLGLGETKTGWKMLEDLLDETAAAEHPLMANVINSIAWRRWGDFKEADAQELWHRGSVPTFCESNRNAYNSCRDGLHLACCVRGDFGAFEESIFAGVKEENHKRRADIVAENANWLMRQLNWGDSQVNRYFAGKYPKESDRGPKMKAFRKNFLAWFEGKRPDFAAEKRDFEFDVLNVRMHYGYETTDELMKRIYALLGTVSKLKDDSAINGRVNTCIGLFIELGKWEEALAAVDRIKGALYAAWRRYEVTSGGAHHGKFKWKDCVAHLEEYLDRKPDEGGVKTAKYALARLLRDRCGDPERALKIFLDLSDPPTSLWELVWTYRALKQNSKAAMTLDEIASLFADQAPRAVWTMAQYCEQDGNKKQAIALYRRLLSQPEWKKSGESSQAHQALERLGVATGGAMVNEVR